MPEYRFDHVHLYSQDPEKTADFYVKMFGAEKLAFRDEGEGRKIADLVLNGIDIKVSTPWEADDKDSEGLDHFGMITDDLDAAIAELKGKGVKFVMEKTSLEACDISFFLGPEDTLIELIAVKSQGDK